PLATSEDHKFVAAIEKLMGQSIPRLEGEDASVLDEAPAEDRKRRDDRKRHGKDRDKSKGKDRKAEARGGRAPREDAKSDTASRPEVEAPAQAQAPARPPNQDRRDKGRDDRRRDREDGTPVVGLGDHVPAFLMVSFGTVKRAEGEAVSARPVSSERSMTEATPSVAEKPAPAKAEVKQDEPVAAEAQAEVKQAEPVAAEVQVQDPEPVTVVKEDPAPPAEAAETPEPAETAAPEEPA